MLGFLMMLVVPLGLLVVSVSVVFLLGLNSATLAEVLEYRLNHVVVVVLDAFQLIENMVLVHLLQEAKV